MDTPSVESGYFLHNLLLFGRVCRALGMGVTPGRMIEAAQALNLIALDNKADFYHTLRAVLVTCQQDFAIFDQAFHAFWRRPISLRDSAELQSLLESRYKRNSKRAVLEIEEETAADDRLMPDFSSSEVAFQPTYSQQELLRHKDFGEMSDEELALARQMIERLPKSLGYRRSRRFCAGRGSLVDMRRALRGSLRYAGEVVDLPERHLKQKPRSLVLICDISGSMERYTRLLLYFLHTLANTMYQVETFVFSTRLTPITHPIRHKSVDVAMGEVSRKVKDWGGGTRTGEALRTFNYRWARRVLGRGAVVMIISDGWDRGDPELLRHEMERLQRSCHRLIWLNPLLGAEQYEPLTRGAQAMLPFVDDFLPVRNLANLESLLMELRKIEGRR